MEFESDQVELINERLEGQINIPLSPLKNKLAYPSNLSSSSSSSSKNLEFNTLDEPVKDTILRDVKAVWHKFSHVLYPKKSKSLLKEWDLWGPLMLCIILAIFLNNSSSTKGPQFAEIFLIYWLGSAIVTLNIKLLGGYISIFQGVCVLGYCVMPLATSLIIIKIITIVSNNIVFFIMKFIIIIIAISWSVFASTAFLVDCQPSQRKPLALYPIFLFYFFIGWIIISNN